MSTEALDLSLSNSLTDLASRIRAEHEASAVAMKRSLEHAMAAGALLLEAKAQLKHGQWGPWLAEHCAMSDRTARLYMRLAKRRPDIEKNGSVADLSARGAIEILTGETAPLLVSQSTFHWWLGDWWNYAVEHFGEEYCRALVEGRAPRRSVVAHKNADRNL
jgi:hypothetical protein